MGGRLLRVELRNFRCSFVRTTWGSAPAEEAPEAYPDSRSELVESMCSPIVNDFIAVCTELFSCEAERGEMFENGWD